MLPVLLTISMSIAPASLCYNSQNARGWYKQKQVLEQTISTCINEYLQPQGGQAAIIKVRLHKKPQPYLRKKTLKPGDIKIEIPLKQLPSQDIWFKSSWLGTEITGMARLSISYRAAVANQNVSTNQMLTTENVSTVLIPFQKYAQDTIQQIPVGLVASRPIKQGQILKQAMLSNPIMVKRGETVTLKVRNNGITVSTRGVALDAGRQGNMIRVKQAQQQKTIMGMVQLPGLVEVLQ